jgi:hypothetical protein
MSVERYRVLARLAGDALVEFRLYPVPVGEPSGEEQKAVYVCINRRGFACYAGRTRPDTVHTDAAGRRIAQHLRSPSKRDEWCEYWTFPLADDTEPHDVDEFERAVCARLGLPLRNRRWRKARSGP